MADRTTISREFSVDLLLSRAPPLLTLAAVVFTVCTIRLKENPWIYYPVWYVGESIVFWKEFLKQDPGVKIVLENVLETKTELILDIVKGVDDPRFRMCLDVGHVNAYSDIPLNQWLEVCAPWINHFHTHNNDGREDQHRGLQDGTISMKELLHQIEAQCPNATITLEVVESQPSVEWLLDESILE